MLLVHPHIHQGPTILPFNHSVCRIAFGYSRLRLRTMMTKRLNRITDGCDPRPREPRPPPSLDSCTLIFCHEFHFRQFLDRLLSGFAAGILTKANREIYLYLIFGNAAFCNIPMSREDIPQLIFASVKDSEQ